MPKRTRPEPDPDAFERMARELGCEETGEAFERALSAVLPPRRRVAPTTPKVGGPTPKRRRRSRKRLAA
jgi:hypothetical protein